VIRARGACNLVLVVIFLLSVVPVSFGEDLPVK